MKKTASFFISVVIVTFLVHDINASGYREVYADYQDTYITMRVRSKNISGYSRSKKTFIVSKSVSFEISARPGYKIFNKSNVQMNGKIKYFKGTESVNNYYTTGKTWFRGSPGRNGEFRVEYYMCKDGSTSCQRISKNFRLSLDRPSNPHGKTKGEITVL